MIILTKFYLFNYNYIMRVAVFLSFKNSLKTWVNSGTIERELKLFEEFAIKYNYQFTFFTYGKNEKDTFPA